MRVDVAAVEHAAGEDAGAAAEIVVALRPAHQQHFHAARAVAQHQHRCGRADVGRRLCHGLRATPAACSAAISSALKPASDSTASVCMPMAGAGVGGSARAAVETRRGAGLHHAGHLDEGAARPGMRVLRRLLDRQHRREAGVAAFEQGAPFVTRLAAQDGGHRRAHLGPQLALVLALHEARVQADALRHLGKELRLQRADGHVAAVGRLVGVVEGRAAVEQVVAALVVPAAGGRHAVEDRHQRGRAVDHRRIHHLAAPGALALVQRGQQAHRQVQRAAAVVAHQVQRRHRLAAGRADGMQRAGQRDVVQVVPGRLRQRAALAEAGHAAVDQARIARMAVGRAQAQALGHAGAEALDQHVGAGDQAHHGVAAGRRLQVQRHRAPVAPADLEALVHRHAQAAGLGAVDAHHVGAHVGQQHGAHRAGADAGQFDDAQSFQRSHGWLVLRVAPRQRGRAFSLPDA